MKLFNHLIQDYRVADPYEGTHAFRDILLKGDVVVVKEHESYVGLLTLNDIINRPYNLVIDSLSPKPSIQVDDDTLSSLMFMCENNYDFLPAMRDKEFVGIISRKHLLLSVLLAKAKRRDQDDINEVTQLKKEISLKNKFLAIIGHDVKSLFTQVLGSLELLDHNFNQAQESKAHSILRLARRSAEQVNAAFDGMLLWARLATGQLPFQPEYLKLNDCINKIINQFQLAGNVKNITIKNCLEPGINIYADPNMLGCILLNLVYNAIKFTPVGGEIWLAAKEDDYQTEILIVDSGTGMTIQQKDRLFKSGTSTKGTTNEMGVGLGLVICKDFVDKHNGKIEVESEQGKGTKVIISFPKGLMRFCYKATSRSGLN